MIQLSFGYTQPLMSKRMRAYPRLAKWVHYLFGYTQVGNYARAGVFQKLLRSFPLEDCQEVLDLGCGQGEYAFSMATALADKKITGLDIEPERILKIEGVAAEKGMTNLDTFCGSMEALQQTGRRFDFIYSIDVFEHIQEEEMPFEAAYAALNEGGYLLVKMPAKKQFTIFPQRLFQEHQQWLDEEHIGQVYELADLQARFERTGFQIQTAFYADGPAARLAWELNYLAQKLGPLVQLALLPLNKLLVRIDQSLGKLKKGNTIQVIGQKIAYHAK